MTGPFGMGVLRPKAGPANLPVAFGGVLAANAHGVLINPATWDWQPWDYVVALARDIFGTALTLPSWLSRLDGLGSTVTPAILGGWHSDGVMDFVSMDDGAGNRIPGYRFTYANTQDNAKSIVIARYRNVASATGVPAEAFDNSPANLDLGAITIPTDGVGVMVGAISGSGGTTPATLSSFVPVGSGITDRYPSVIALRAYEKAGPAAGYQFNVANVAELSNPNGFGAAALTGGPALYNPTTTPTYVGAGTLVTTHSTGAVSVPPPSGLNAGDLLFMVSHAQDGGGDGFGGGPSGWLFVGRYNTHSRDTKVFMKRAIGGGSDTNAALTVWTGITGFQIRMYAYRGVGGLKWAGGAGTNTLTPLIDTTVPNTLAIATLGADFYVPTGMSSANGFTQRDIQAPGGTGGYILAEKLMAAPGATSYPVFSTASGNFTSCQLLHLLPAN